MWAWFLIAYSRLKFYFIFKAPVNFYCKGGPGQSVGELEALPGGSLSAVAVG